MEPLNIAHNNNHRRRRRRFNNPFNLDPKKEDISIERKLENNLFCPMLAMLPSFGYNNEYYSLITINPLKESFFHAIEAMLFPNATLLQISSIFCYIITIIFIIILCFGLDETNPKVFLQAKLSTVDTIGSFYPKRIKQNFWEYYRLFTFHFLHFNFSHLMLNIAHLLILGSYFEQLIKKYIFILIFFLTGIFSTLSSISFFGENERYCGMDLDSGGICGAFIMLFIMNHRATIKIFGNAGKFWTLYIICFYGFIYIFLFIGFGLGNPISALISLVYGALIFAILVKPIKRKKWKTIVRFTSGIIILTFTILSLIGFYGKE